MRYNQAVYGAERRDIVLYSPNEDGQAGIGCILLVGVLGGLFAIALLALLAPRVDTIYSNIITTL